VIVRAIRHRMAKRIEDVQGRVRLVRRDHRQRSNVPGELGAVTDEIHRLYVGTVRVEVRSADGPAAATGTTAAAHEY
jgi:hypothetical protein